MKDVKFLTHTKYKINISYLLALSMKSTIIEIKCRVLGTSLETMRLAPS